MGELGSARPDVVLKWKAVMWNESKRIPNVSVQAVMATILAEAMGTR